MTLAYEERPAALPAELPRTRPAPLRELLLIAALWLAYSLGRLAADGHVAAAMTNADRVWDLERLLRLPSETGLQHLLLRAGLVGPANDYYAYVHFPATIGFLLWVYLSRPGHYRAVRNTLALLTAAALVVHLIFPLAPPRMLAVTGLVDTGRLYGPSVYGTPGAGGVTNQYAAMPSLHVGWALLVAITLITLTRGRWRWLWLAHPLLTLLVVVGTANHYWLDAIVAAALLIMTLRLTGLTRSARQRQAGAEAEQGGAAEPVEGPAPARAGEQPAERGHQVRDGAEPQQGDRDRGRPRAGGQELRQQRQEEDRRLRVEGIAEQAVTERATGRARTRRRTRGGAANGRA